MVTRKLAVLLPILLAGPAGVLAQETGTSPHAPIRQTEGPDVEPPTFTAEVEQVIVDLVVTDGNDNPVPGISKDDLIISEDGAPQTATSFEAVHLPDEPGREPPPPPRISRNTHTSAARGRTFVIVFDDMNLTPHRARDAKAAVASFLTSGVRAGDSVTLLATSGAAWWTSRMTAGRDDLMETLEQLEARRIPDSSRGYLSDWEAMRIHVFQDPQVVRRVMRRFDKYGVGLGSRSSRSDPLAGTLSDPFVNARANEVYYESLARTRRTLDALERALNGLAGARGRKSIILVSEGFIYDAAVQGFKRVNTASRRANAAIYFVNARGLEGMPSAFSAELGPAPVAQDVGYDFALMNRFDDGSETLASESGGFTVKNTNDLEQGIQRIAAETQVYYLVGYVSSNTARDGAFREIEVKFKKGAGKGLKIRARRGYYAPSDTGQAALTTGEEIDPVVQAAIDSPWPEDGIPLRMTHYVGSERMLGKASVLVVTELDIGVLEFEEVEGRQVAEVGFLLAVSHRESGEFIRYDQAVTMRLHPTTHERLSREWFPIVREFELQPGDQEARIVVVETGTGRLGSVVHAFEVPPLDELRVTTPILSDTHEPKADGDGLRPRPLARREFPKGRELLCQFAVYGAARDERGMPMVKEGHEVRRSDGTLIARQPPTTIGPTSLGALFRQFGVSLEKVAPGDYEMLIMVEDELAGKVIQLQEPFTVVRSIAASPASPPALSGHTRK